LGIVEESAGRNRALASTVGRSPAEPTTAHAPGTGLAMHTFRLLFFDIDEKSSLLQVSFLQIN
jgi:hypothetical protein